MKIKCDYKKCWNCPFRNGTDWDTVCNLSQHWKHKTIEIRIIKKGRGNGDKKS